MALTRDAQDALAVTVDGWFENSTGTSALDVAESLSMDHSAIMELFEHLAATGYGSLKRDVQLFQLSIDLDDPSTGFKSKPVTTHIFFPSTEVLRESFFSSDLPRQHLPEYTTRLHLGASQVGLVFFDEEVLARYLNHPERYRVNDSLAGGEISSAPQASEDSLLDLRYGKCPLKSGHIAVTAIYKDLSSMAESEQRYWHSHELDSPETDTSDVHFQTFLARTYEGSWDDYEDPIARLLKALSAVNNAFEPIKLFAEVENAYVQLPSEQTYKSYCDAASELYKSVGPDGMSQCSLKNILTEQFGVSASELKHPESGRPLSNFQLFAFLEAHLGTPDTFTKYLRELRELRVAADHKVLGPDSTKRSYSRDFAALCDQLAQALEEIARTRATQGKSAQR